MSTSYKFEAPYRNWLTIAGLIFASIFTVFAYSKSVPWYFMAIVGIPTLLLAYNVLVNPVSGVDLNSRYLRVYCGSWEKRVNIDNIERLKIIRSSDGGDLFALYVRKGKKIVIPSLCIGSTDVFEKTSKNLGITVEAR